MRRNENWELCGDDLLVKNGKNHNVQNIDIYNGTGRRATARRHRLLSLGSITALSDAEDLE